MNAPRRLVVLGGVLIAPFQTLPFVFCLFGGQGIPKLFIDQLGELSPKHLLCTENKKNSIQ